MNTLQNSPKKIRERAMRYKRSLLKEQREHGYINDGAGKRYLIGPLFYLSGDLQKATEYFEWYEKEFYDDSGEPLHYIYWTLALLKNGEEKKAETKFSEALIQNIYLLPKLVGLDIGSPDIWHGSNWAQPEYILELQKEMLPQLTEDENNWIRKKIQSLEVRRIIKEYIATYKALKNQKDIKKRSVILDKWRAFQEEAFK
jgi:tetratricopeptide (TPR) repeat protein